MKKYYLPTGDAERLAWLTNFEGKISGYASGLGITGTEVTDITKYLAMLKYVLSMDDAVITFKQDVTKFKTLLMIAPIGSVLGAVPVLTLGAAPTITPAGIFTIIAGIVARIKASGNYTEAIGEDLKIIGADIIIDLSGLKPALKLKLEVGNPKIKYKKNRMDGLNLYRDNDGSGFKFLKFITKATYLDEEALPTGVTTAVVKYMGIYVKNDIQVGIPSDEAKITVTKVV